MTNDKEHTATVFEKSRDTANLSTMVNYSGTRVYMYPTVYIAGYGINAEQPEYRILFETRTAKKPGFTNVIFTIGKETHTFSSVQIKAKKDSGMYNGVLQLTIGKNGAEMMRSLCDAYEHGTKVSVTLQSSKQDDFTFELNSSKLEYLAHLFRAFEAAGGLSDQYLEQVTENYVL